MSNDPVVEQTDAPVSPKPKKKRKRVFLWFFLAVQALFLIWLVTGINSVASSAGENCGTLDAKTCADATAIGGGIGAMLIIGLWVAVDFILGISYLIKVAATRHR